MLYEKKMLILSGSGKGVVLIEKSAAGTKFTLRTFDLPARALPFKAGVVTKTKVYVRDLPHRDNPVATFTLELDSLDGLHFAVFDRELRLYGCIGKRMWEANLMGLLNKNDRRPPVTKSVPTALPPISEPPRVLPLPDGTGIPQSRIGVYGDDALAESDFYTKIDMSERMPVVDEFLDSPRVLDGLAPEIESAPSEDGAALSAAATTAALDREIIETDAVDISDIEEAETDSATEDVTTTEYSDMTTAPAETGEPDDAETTAAPAPVETTINPTESRVPPAEHVAETTTFAESATTEPPKPPVASAEHATAAGMEAELGANTETSASSAEFEPTFEAAATAEQPWEKTARWIKKRGGRELVVKKPRVRPTSAGEKLRHLRATEFFERVRRDVDILFASARRDEALNGLIDDVEWVKVDVDGNTVSVGRSGNAFLCYAVAGTYSRTPPLGEEAQWLPRDKNTPTGKGYWVIFQNLTTGEIIK